MQSFDKRSVEFMSLFDGDPILILNFVHLFHFCSFNIEDFVHIKLAFTVITVEILLRPIIFVDPTRMTRIR